METRHDGTSRLAYKQAAMSLPVHIGLFLICEPVVSEQGPGLVHVGPVSGGSGFSRLNIRHTGDQRHIRIHNTL